jgi:acetolactate synthase-1/2/3 large subunit
VVRGVLHESRDQAAMFEPLAKAVLRPRTPEDAVRAVAWAAETAMTSPRGPVYLDIPADVLDSEVGLPDQLRYGVPARVEPAAEAIERAVQTIESAPRTVIWAGGGVVESDAGAELAALAARLAAPVVTTFAARGVLGPDHPWLVGLPPHEPEVAAYLGSADLLLVLGSQLDGASTRNWTMPRPPLLVAVNVSEADLVKSYQPDVAVLGDVKLVLGELLSRVLPRDSGRQLAEVRERTWDRLRGDRAGGPALAFLDALEVAVSRAGATVVVDMAIPGYWYGGYARVERPRSLAYPIGWGTLGFALPASVGAAAAGRPVLAVCGDGGFMFAVGELAVLRQENLPVTVLVVDDGGYGMLRYDQDRAGDEHRGVDLFRPDFAALAAAFGIPATVLDDGEGDRLSDVLREALESGEPRLVVLELALTPPRTTSPRWRD